MSLIYRHLSNNSFDLIKENMLLVLRNRLNLQIWHRNLCNRDILVHVEPPSGWEPHPHQHRTSQNGIKDWTLKLYLTPWNYLLNHQTHPPISLVHPESAALETDRRRSKLSWPGRPSRCTRISPSCPWPSSWRGAPHPAVCRGVSARAWRLRWTCRASEQAEIIRFI